QVEPAEAITRSGEQRGHRVLVGDVGLHREDHFRQRPLHRVLEQLEAAAGRDDVPPLVGQRDRDKAAEPGTCAGDDRHLLSCHDHYGTAPAPDSTAGWHGGRGWGQGPFEMRILNLLAGEGGLRFSRKAATPSWKSLDPPSSPWIWASS